MSADLSRSSADDAETERLGAAMKRYALGQLSSGAAARLAGIPRTVFLSRLADYGIDTFALTEVELEQQSGLSDRVNRNQ